MALEGSQQHHQRQGDLAAGNAGGDLIGGTVGGPAAGIINISPNGSAGGGGSFALFPIRGIPVPAELISSPFASKLVDLDHRCKVLPGWQRCLNLKNGKIFFKDLLTEDEEEEEDDASDMSRSGKSPKLDLRLNLSTHRGSSSEVAGRSAGNNSNRSNSPNSSSSSSPPSSCLSSETEQGRFSSSPEPTSMVLVGCPRCLMYVMLSEDDPRCPKCKSTVLLDFLKDPKSAAASTKKTRKN